MRRGVLVRLGGVAAATAFALAPAARAESRDPRTVALGWLTENADAVVLGPVVQEARLPGSRVVEAEVRADETIRGAGEAGATLTVACEDHGEGLPWVAGDRRLWFLRALPAAPGGPKRWTPLSGPFGVRAVPAEGPAARLPGLVRALAATLGEGGEVRDPAALRALLVRWIEDDDPGVAWTGATDLVRHAELHGDLSPEERNRIVAAFRRCPVGKDTKRVLAEATAVTRDPAAAAALVDALREPGARDIRGAVGDALRRLGDPSATRRILDRLEGADAPRRADLLEVLGALGAVEAAEAVRRAVEDPVAAVRVEAAHALGLLARAAREGEPSARVGGRERLERMLAGARAENEVRASLWALAQLDEPEAWAALRRAVQDDRETVRRYAERYLRTPRQSLILR